MIASPPLMCRNALGEAARKITFDVFDPHVVENLLHRRLCATTLCSKRPQPPVAVVSFSRQLPHDAGCDTGIVKPFDF